MSGFTSEDYAEAIAKRIASDLSSADEIPIEKGDDYSEGYVAWTQTEGAMVRLPFQVDTIDAGEFIVTVRAVTKDDG
ncbi:hypothetical protein GCM10027456_26130 [Kineosporia babensis]